MTVQTLLHLGGMGLGFRVQGLGFVGRQGCSSFSLCVFGFVMV